MVWRAMSDPAPTDPARPASPPAAAPNALLHPADLRATLALTPVLERPGCYRAQLTRAWSFLFPSGGVLMSLALQAMRDTLAQRRPAGLPTLVPVSATATFCSAIAEGPLDLEVQVLRSGRTATQLRAHIRPLGAAAAPGDVGVEVAAVFGAAEGPALAQPACYLPRPPIFPAPADCKAYDAVAQRVTPPPFYRNLEIRMVHGDVWWTADWPPGDPHTARYFRYLVPPAAADGTLDPLALPPIADTMASAVHQVLGRTNPPLIFPSLDLTVHFVNPIATPADAFLLVDANAHALWPGVASASATVWDDAGRLLCFATQTMSVREARAPRPNPTAPPTQ